MLKLLRPLCILLIAFGFTTDALTQPSCGFDKLHELKMRTNEEYRRFIKNFEEKIRKQAVFPNNNSVVPDFADTIPVVVHIVHTGDTIGSIYNPADEQIQAAIDFTNQVYAGTYPGIKGAGDIGIRIALAKRDPNCNPTTGIDRTDGSAISNYASGGVSMRNANEGITPEQLMNFIRWDPYRYYNIWIVNSINRNDIAGFTFFPYNFTEDGIIIAAQYMHAGNFTLPHELGHAFFLYHPFEGSSGSMCPLNNNCNTDGDHVCDTDPITAPSGDNRSGINPCTSTPYTANTEENIMNYVCCRSRFTEGQKMRMQQTTLINILRDTLTKSTARFPVDAEPACKFVLQLEGKLVQNDVILFWQGAGDNGYIIERSYDGARFTVIGFIPYKQVSGNFSFTDKDIAQQINYYRLKQNLSNGNTIYSNTVVFNDPIRRYDQLTVLNNPAHDYIDLQLGLLHSKPGTIGPVLQATAAIRVFDMSGKMLRQFAQPVRMLQRFRMPVDGLPAGIYLLEISLNDQRYLTKIVKL